MLKDMGEEDKGDKRYGRRRYSFASRRTPVSSWRGRVGGDERTPRPQHAKDYRSPQVSCCVNRF